MLSADSLLQDAKAESGLSDYGALDFVEGLNVLVKSINAEAGLTPDNEARYRPILVRILCNRLRMQRDVKRHPEILDEEVLPPVFITSLPRTGSTKLHRMLAASGDFNAMSFWQSFNFAPFTDPPATPDPRIAAAEKFLDWTTSKAPLFQEAHPMYADETEEELYILDAGFNSLYNHASFLHVPSYVDWVLKLDPHQAYRDLRSILQYMQWQHFRGLKRRWVLKTPALLGTEATFADVFKGTDFIVTHRDPKQILGSVCALFSGIRALYNEYDYADVAAATMMYSFGITSQAHLQWREKYPADKVMDVRIGEIVSNEFDLLPKIYEFLNIPFDDVARNNIQAWLKKDAARRQTPRQFTLADYGMTAEQVDEKFAGYLQRYKDFL